jgi:hypothetical protein
MPEEDAGRIPCGVHDKDHRVGVHELNDPFENDEADNANGDDSAGRQSAMLLLAAIGGDLH